MQRPLLLALVLLAFGAPASAAAAAVTVALEHPSVVYGTIATASGTVDPPTAGSEVTVALDGVPVGAGVTGDGGTYAVTFTATASGLVVATTADATSAGARLGVVPRIRLAVGKARSFLSTRVTATIAPASFRGTLEVAIARRGHLPGRTRAVAVRRGKALFHVTPNGIGMFVVTVRTSPTGDLDATTAHTTFTAAARGLAVGAEGGDVRELLRRLERLGFHTPGPSSILTAAAADSVMAFQKAFGLDRTYVFGPRDWFRLLHPRRLEARYRGQGTHIEIDKTRQILMIVRDGHVRWIVAVSTGATGNTPEGAFSVLWRAPRTTTWLGPAILWWTMTFHGDFAIHGFAPVPPYPASHGCVREPIWISPWVYQLSSVGEPVYVYH